MTIVSDVEIRLRADIARLQQDMTQARRDVTGALDSMSASAQAVKGLLTGLAAGLNKFAGDRGNYLPEQATTSTDSSASQPG